MKTLLLRLLLSLSLVIGFTTILKAQPKKICFYDDFGIKYNITSVRVVDKDVYYGKGTTDAYPGGKATIRLDVSGGPHFGIAEIHAINGEPDGCNVWSDSFFLRGVVYVVRVDGDNLGFLVGGTWESFCYGSVLNVGTWSGIGPCSLFNLNEIKKKADPTKKTPFQGGGNVNTKKDDFSIKVIPNPIKNNAQLRYKLTSPGKINITIYDFMHQPVKVLVNEYKTPGDYIVQWNAVNTNGLRVSQGLYEVVTTVGSKIYSNTIQVLP
ncbi:MAG TPA: hypothetical protein VH396_22325 [Chitinophagaceae bacterium]|jgi:hypothetical protein